MKYITLLSPGFIPVSVLFSHHLTHLEMATKLGTPVLGAGVVRIDQGKATVSSYATALRAIADQTIDPALIEHDFELTRREFQVLSSAAIAALINSQISPSKTYATR